MANDHVLNIREQEAEAARKRIAAGFVARLGGTLDAMVPALFQTFPTRITYVERYTAIADRVTERLSGSAPLYGRAPADTRQERIGDGYTPPLCKDCRHSHDDRRPLGSGPPILTCDRYRSLVDGVTRDPCSAVRNFRCGWQGTGFEAKAATAFGNEMAENMRRIEGGE